jgi:hypothetical protein
MKLKHISRAIGRKIVFAFAYLADIFRTISILIRIKKGGVAIVELNPYHMEIMYSIYDCCKSRRVKIFTTRENIRICMFKGIDVDIVEITPRVVKYMDIFGFWNRFDGLLVGSWFVWQPKKTADRFFPRYLKHRRMIVIEHAPGVFAPEYSENPNVRKIILSEALSKKYGFPSFYACVFPKHFDSSVKKDIDFLSIGIIGDPEKRDADIFIDFMARNPNARAYVIASLICGNYRERLSTVNIPFSVKVPFDFMFDKLQHARFLPFLIHGDNMGYYKNAVSGNMNLALGFSIVPIIDKDLAKLYGFDETTAVMYDGAEDFDRAMISALNMPTEEYNRKVVALIRLRDRLIEHNTVLIESELNGDFRG